jgi:hypothetical protein
MRDLYGLSGVCPGDPPLVYIVSKTSQSPDTYTNYTRRVYREIWKLL